MLVHGMNMAGFTMVIQIFGEVLGSSLVQEVTLNIYFSLKNIKKILELLLKL